MKEDEFREILERETTELGVKLSEKQIKKFYLYMRTFIRVE